MPRHILEFYVPEILGIDLVRSATKNNITWTVGGRVAYVDNKEQDGTPVRLTRVSIYHLWL